MKQKKSGLRDAERLKALRLSFGLGDLLFFIG
jgi:hypothetical protein